MMVFVIAETEKGARDLCAGARTLGSEVALISFSEQTTIAGIADVVYRIDVPTGAVVESAAATVSALAEDKAPAIVLVEPTRRMKVIAGKVAAKFGTSVITDVSAFDGEVARSLYFGGIATRDQKSTGDISIFTCTSAPFGDAEATGADVVQTVAFVADGSGVTVRSREPLPKSDVNLAAAKRIVAAGRGFAAEEDLQMARDFAAAIGGELGCTRPLTEAEDWMPREAYIGISGLMLSPEVYVGIGVSGQMQHMVGVNGAKVAFAINKDKNAPIFNQVDYGLVGDLNAVLPAINEKLK